MNIAYREKCIAGCRVDSASTPESSSKYAFVYVPSPSFPLAQRGGSPRKNGKGKSREIHRSCLADFDRAKSFPSRFIDSSMNQNHPEGGKFEVSRSEIIGNRLTRRKDKNHGGEESLDIGRYWLDRSRRLRRRDRCKPRRVAARYSSRYDVINFAFYRVGSTINYSRGT